MKPLTWIIAAAIGLASPAFAHASDAFVTTNVNLQAGPDPDYPQVDVLEGGSQVSVLGCTAGWEWCDVAAYGERGWVPGNYLEFDYQNQWVLVPAYAPTIGIPVVEFSINNYWDRYYRGRPFYGQRGDWYHRHFPHRPAPRPIDVPPPHPIFGAPVQHHPIYGAPAQNRPIYGAPAHRPPHPPPPGIVVPMPHPVPNPPPRVVPMPHPVPDAPPQRNDHPRSDSRDQGGPDQH